MKILNFGSCNIDYVYSVKHFIQPGETLSADGMNIFPGGKGLNQSIAVARAGGKIYHAGCIGSDGEFLRNLLNESTVNTDFLKTVDQKTGHAIIEVTPDGENRIMIFGGANYAVTEECVDSILAHFEKGDVLMLQNEISCRKYILKKAKEKGMTVVFNAAPFEPEIASEDLSAVKYLIVNMTEAEGLVSKSIINDIISEMTSKYKNTNIILTLGKNGCIYFNKNEKITQNAFSVKAVDSTAAGDTFIGYFVAGIAQNQDIRSILKSSCCASALSVTKPGASSSIPKIGEVLKAQKCLKPIKPDIFTSVAKDYIDENLKTASLGGLSEKLNYSKSYATRKFTEAFGMPFSKYLQHARCEAAKDLLIKTNLSVSEIANACGYESDGHFRSTFKAHTGSNPLEFRKKEGTIK